jgi:hypothetical protein
MMQAIACIIYLSGSRAIISYYDLGSIAPKQEH